MKVKVTFVSCNSVCGAETHHSRDPSGGIAWRWRTCNLRRGTMIVILWLMCTGFHLVSSSEEVIEKAAGSNITLIPQYVGGSSGISWWFRGHIITGIKLEPPKRVYIYPRFHHLKNRTLINNSTGHMTLKSLTEEDSGGYRAEAVVNNMDQVTRIRLIVAAHPPEVMVKPSGSRIILTPQYSGAPTEVSWWRGPRILARAQLSPSAEVAYYDLKGRADINPSTGHLTIRHLHVSDAADYRAEALVNGTFQYTLMKLTVTDGSDGGLSGGAIAGIVLAVCLTLIIPGVLFYKCGHKVTKFRAPPVFLVSVRSNTRISSKVKKEQNQM